MELVIISDTHGQHEGLGVLRGDVLIHCGDFTIGERGSQSVIASLDTWFAAQQFKLILCTGGNHDFMPEEANRRGESPFRHARYLVDELVTFEGLSFYGAPWVPELAAWAHYLNDAELRQRWAKIPDAVDVLITHTPPRGVLDKNSRGRACGCVHLQKRLEDVRLGVHCFGHIHASAGVVDIAGTTYVNASVVNSHYRLARDPVRVEIAEPRSRV